MTRNPRIEPCPIRVLREIRGRNCGVMDDSFPSLSFRGTLRPSQAEVVAIAQKKLAEGARRLHIVAPPGSGKTVLGLYLWAACVRRPALVLSPNSAIQAQWAAKCELFEGTGNCAISTDVQSPGL